MPGWTQPTLDGASLRAFDLSARWHFGVGYEGRLNVIQEGETAWVQMIRWSELSSDQMIVALAVAIEQVTELLGGD